MSLSIRLARVGRKNAPAFKIVVSNTRDKRNGKFLDVIGYYNPSTTPVQQNLDVEAYDSWVSKGALVTDAVKQIKEGTYVFVPYTRQNEQKDQPKQPEVKAEQNAADETTIEEQPKEQTQQEEQSQEQEKPEEETQQETEA